MDKGTWTADDDFLRVEAGPYSCKTGNYSKEAARKGLKLCQATRCAIAEYLGREVHSGQGSEFVSTGLASRGALEAELAEVQLKIQLDDDLIDQIIYKLYGLTIVEGRACHGWRLLSTS